MPSLFCVIGVLAVLARSHVGIRARVAVERPLRPSNTSGADFVSFLGASLLSHASKDKAHRGRRRISRRTPSCMQTLLGSPTTGGHSAAPLLLPNRSSTLEICAGNVFNLGALRANLSLGLNNLATLPLSVNLLGLGNLATATGGAAAGLSLVWSSTNAHD